MDTRNLTQVGRMWYLTAMVNGVRISKSLRTDDLAEARRKRDEILGERLASRDEVTLLKSVRRQLEGIQFEEMERASSRTSGELLMYAHRKWLHSANRRYCGEHQEHMHVSHWKDCLDWLRKAHPEILYCRQLKTVYSQRRSHPLDEWQDFCRFIESLEASHLIVGVLP